MAAEVESMFYVRETPWHGLGVRVEEAPNSEEAMRLAGLDWRVDPQKVYLENGKEVLDTVANVRDSDGSVLGVVSNRYQIIQNADAFSFTDNLLGNDVRYETAGSLFNGKKVWLLARMPETRIVDDKVTPYICFTNTHDGSGAVRVCMTPVRVVCNNTLNIALSGAPRTWATRHTGNIEEKMKEAEETLFLANRYMSELDKKAMELANTEISNRRVAEIVASLFPLEEDAPEIVKKRIEEAHNTFARAYNMPDIRKFKGTAWGVINAAADFLHRPPQRKTKNFKANEFNRIIGGHPFLDKVVRMVA